MLTAGYNIHKQRGGVVAAIATMGVIVGTGSVMLRCYVNGTFGSITMKKFDDSVQQKIKTGFEMLVNNFFTGF